MMELKEMLDDVIEFRELFGLSVGDYQFKKDNPLHESLFIEELTELMEANNPTEQLDALVDIAYIACGRLVHAAWLGHIDHDIDCEIIRYVQIIAERKGFDFPAAWKHIHASNMSKACGSIVMANATVNFYANEKNIEAMYSRVGGKYVVTCVNDPSGEVKEGKVLKSLIYSPADVTPFTGVQTNEA